MVQTFFLTFFIQLLKVLEKPNFSLMNGNELLLFNFMTILKVLAINFFPYEWHKLFHRILIEKNNK